MKLETINAQVFLRFRLLLRLLTWSSISRFSLCHEKSTWILIIETKESNVLPHPALHDY